MLLNLIAINFVSIPSSVLKGFTSAHLSEFQTELNFAVLKDMRSNKDNISVTVLAVDITRKESEWLWCTAAVFL